MIGLKLRGNDDWIVLGVSVYLLSSFSFSAAGPGSCMYVLNGISIDMKVRFKSTEKVNFFGEKNMERFKENRTVRYQR